MSRFVRMLGGFAMLQILSFVAPFVALPVVARVAGAHGWVSLATAQAIGTLAGAVVLYGWWTVGPGEYHRLGRVGERKALFRRSWYTRLLVAGPVVPISCVITDLLASPGWRLEAVFMNLATLVMGLSPAWLFIAAGSPAKLAIYETLPRAGATVLAVAAMLVTRSVLPYPLLIGLASAGAASLAVAIEAPRGHCEGIDLGELWADIIDHTPVAMSNILGALYSQFSVPLATAFAPTYQVAPYVSGDKLAKAARFFITALGNTLQSWTLETNAKQRHIRAILGHVLLGTLGCAGMTVLLPETSRILFGPSLAPTYLTSFGMGLAFMAVSITTPLVRNILIPARCFRTPLFATAAAAASALAAFYPLDSAMGVNGIALAMALAEFVNLGFNLGPARKILMNMDHPVETGLDGLEIS